MSTFSEKVQHKIEIIPPFKIIQCRTENIVEKDGDPLASTFERTVYLPGDDVSLACAEVQEVANLFWTEEVVQTYLSSVKTEE